MEPGLTQGFTLGYGLKVSPSGLLSERMTGATSTVATCVMGIKNARKRMKNVPYHRNSAEPSTNPAD